MLSNHFILCRPLLLLPQEPHEQYKKAKDTPEEELPRSDVQYATGEEWRNSSINN